MRFERGLALCLRHTDKMSAKVVGKKEILLQKQEVGVNVEKTEGHCSAAE